MLTVLTGRGRRLWPRVLEEIGQAHADGARRILLITPDQFTLQAELELVDRLRLPGLLGIEVLSPSRLLTRVFSLAGSPQRVRVDARGKAMMLADVIRQSREDLAYYKGAVGRAGFADRLSGSIADFKRAGQGPADVALMADALPRGDALGAKLRDIALLFARYEARLEGAFIDGEDAQEALLERLPESGLLDGANIWLYGFDILTPQFIRQVAAMARGALSVRFALTWEKEDAPDGLLFAPMQEALRQLGRQFDEEKLLWDQTHVEAALGAAPEIAHLERQLFAVPPVEYDGVPEAIEVSIASNPYDEAVRVADTLLGFAREGIPFEEMAVVIGNLEDYAGAVEMAFGQGGIPYHLARKKPALAHPLIRSWMAALRCVTLRWRPADAMDWLKGGFSGLTSEEAERLENYAIENGLRDAKWKRPIADPDMEALRQRFVTPLEALQSALGKARDTQAQLTALYRLLEDTDAHGTLEAWQEGLTARGLLAEAAECAQAWRIAMETLDQLHALLRGSRLRMRDLPEVMESGFAAAELQAVPASPGMAQVGQLGHMKISGGCRVLFLMGMQDGVMQAEIATLITDTEAVRAAGEEARFAPSGEAFAQMKQLSLLETLASPTHRLYVSHAVSGPGGEALRPAPALKLLRKVFPGLREGGSSLERTFAAYAPDAALDSMGPALRDALRRGEPLSGAQGETAAWLLHAPQTRLRAEHVLAALETLPPPGRLGTRAANALYPYPQLSISRLESFAQCPFRHFVAYGLRPAPRRAFVVAPDETGTFYHRAMEGYTAKAAETPGWPMLTQEENDALMDAVLAPLRAEWETKPLGDNAMLRATGDALCRVAKRAAWTYADQMRRGGFQTGIVEASFGPGQPLPPIALTLPDGRERWLAGRIDRIDFYEEAGEQWLRVVDYKSGGTALEPSKIYGGLQLQLLLYLAAALAAHPGIAPAGAFYSRFDDPLILTDSRDKEEIERLLAKALRLKGITLSDVRVIQAMDAGDMLKKDGAPRKDADVATAGELAALMRHAHHLATALAAQIAQGEITARPAQLEQWRACQWCDYHSICGFDPAVDGYTPRKLEKLSKEDMLERLHGAEDAEGFQPPDP